MARLYQFSKRLPCYFCGHPGPSTKEHAPPTLLLDGAACDKITVPSCDAHNSGKSGEDRAVATSFVRWIDVIETQGGRPPVKPAVRTLIDGMRPNYAQAKNDIDMQRFSTRLPEGLDFDVPFIRAQVSVPAWVVKLTAALVWSVTGRQGHGSDWGRAWSWSPSFYPSASVMDWDVARRQGQENVFLAGVFERSGTWGAGWQPSPRPYPAELYSFKVCLDTRARDSEPLAIFRHAFYESYFHYIQFPTSAETLDSIGRFLGGEPPEDRSIIPWVRGTAGG